MRPGFIPVWITALLLCFLTMYGLSYVWHGILFNDFFKIYIHNFPQLSKVDYYRYIGSGYAVLSMIIALVYPFIYSQRRSPLLKGIILGLVLGSMAYAGLRYSGLSVYQSSSVSQILVDICWQMIEQGLGGFIFAFVYLKLKNLDLKTLNVPLLIFIFSAPQ